MCALRAYVRACVGVRVFEHVGRVYVRSYIVPSSSSVYRIPQGSSTVTSGLSLTRLVHDVDRGGRAVDGGGW